MAKFDNTCMYSCLLNIFIVHVIKRSQARDCWGLDTREGSGNEAIVVIISLSGLGEHMTIKLNIIAMHYAFNMATYVFKSKL